MRKTRHVGLALASLAIACSGGTTDNGYGNNNGNGPNYPGDPGGTPAQAAVVEVRDDVFVPNSVVVAVGGTVTFEWIGTNGHSVTPSGNPSFSPTAPVRFPPHQLVVNFPNAGTYHYICTIHGGSDGYGGSSGNMVGTITVR